jgi:tripartite-type tricarboxylate transporter receptor subunit TctC
MRVRTAISRAAAGVALALLIGACGGAEETPAAPAAPTPTETETPAEEVDPFADARAFYASEEVTFVVSYGEGGGYDRMARAMAPLLEEFLGTTVFIDNRPGAGGLVAANSLWNGDREGREFGYFAGQGTAASVLGGAEGVSFELEEFGYIARAAAEPRMLTVGTCSPIQTFDEIIAMEDFTFASTGPGGADHIDQAVLFDVFDLKGRTITGYAGSAETQLSVTACDTVAGSGTVSSRAQVLENEDHRMVLVIGPDRLPELPDVKTILEYDLSPEKRAIAESHIAMAELGRMIIAPPGIPQDRLEYLRLAFDSVINDPRLDEAVDPFGPYMTGEDLLATVRVALGSPAAYVAVLKGE